MIPGFKVMTIADDLSTIVSFILLKEHKEAYLERFGGDKIPTTSEYKTWHESLMSDKN
jgi:hypothetical protein